MQKTIIIVNDAAHVTGGAGKVAISSAIGLAQRGYHVIFFSAIPPIEESLKIENLEVICLDQKDILSDSNRLRAIKQGIYNDKAEAEFEKVLKPLSPDSTIIHFHSWTKALSSSLFEITAQLGFKIIITLHDYFICCPNGGLFNYTTNTICKYKQLSISCIASNCDSRNYIHKLWRIARQLVQRNLLSKNQISLIAISALNKRLIQDAFPDIPIFDLKNPIELAEEYVNIQKDGSYVFIGRLSAEKGVRLFCQAVTEMNLPGIVIGDGYLYDELKKEFPNIKFTGWLNSSDIKEHLQCCKAYVFPSIWYEAAPLTPIEVMSYGIPCIISNICAAKEYIIDGKNGYIFNSGDLKSLKEAILKMENTNIVQMSMNVRRFLKKNDYAIDTHINNLLNIYNGI